MKEEDEKLLLADLCARLPYEVKVDHFGTVRELLGMMPSSEIIMVGYDFNDYEDSVIEDIKPYLRSMSSMTKEEREEYLSIKMQETERVALAEVYRPEAISEIMNWLNTKYLDYRGLIPKGLALEAPKGMYK